MRTRRTLAAAGVGVLLLGAIGANPAPEEGDGRAQSELQLLRLGLTDVPGVGDVNSSLGTLVSEARTVDTSSAGLLLRGLEAAGTPVAQRRYADGDSGSESIPLGNVGSVSLIDYLVAVDDRSATATLGALAGELDGTGLGTDLLVSLGERGISSVVTEDGAGSVTTVELPGIGLGIGDLLPDGLLDELPLGLLDELLGALPIELPTDLDDALALLDDVLGDLESLLALETDVLEAHGDLLDLLDVSDLDAALAELDGLRSLVADLEDELAPLRQVVSDREDDVSDVEDAIAAVEAAIADAQDDLALAQNTTSLTTLVGLVTSHDLGCDTGLLTLLTDLRACVTSALQATITGLEATLTSLQSDLAGATASLEQALADLADASGDLDEALSLLGPAEGLLDELLGLLEELEGLLDEVLGGIGALPDLDQLRDDLAGLLAGTQLFGLSDLVIEVVTQADAAGGVATVSCDLGQLSVLGETTRSDVDCRELDASFGAIEAVVGGLLGSLPVELPATVSVGGLQIATATDAPDGGERTATASLSALSAVVGSVGLDTVQDLLTLELGDVLGDVTDALGGLGDLGLLDADLLGGGGLSLASVPTVEATVVDELTGLLGQVGGLPLGDGLDGLRTVGLDLEMAGVDALSGFQAADAPVTTDPVTGEPEAPEAPGTGTPTTGTPTGGSTVTPQPTSAPVTPASTGGGHHLPKTGGGLSLLGLAMLLGATVPRVRRA